MNDALGVMEHLHLGVPTQTRDIRGLTPAVSARNRGFFFCADHIDRTPADQWVVLNMPKPTPTTSTSLLLEATKASPVPNPPDIAP